MKEQLSLTWNNQIFESIAEPVLCINKNDSIVFMNTSFKETFKLEAYNTEILALSDVMLKDSLVDLKKKMNNLSVKSLTNQQIIFSINDQTKVYDVNLNQTIDSKGDRLTLIILKVEVSNDNHEKRLTKRLLSLSKEFIMSSNQSVDYEMIAEEMKKISDAKYVAFNIFDDDGVHFKTHAIVGLSKDLTQASKILGFDFLEKIWQYDPEVSERIKNHAISIFNSIHELSCNAIAVNLIKIIERTFKTGKVAVIKIMKDNKAIGDFTVILGKNQELKHHELLEMFASQVGLYIEKNKAENKLHAVKDRLTLVMQSGQNGFWDWNLEINELFLSDGCYKILGYAPNAFNATIKTWLKLVHPDDLKSVIPDLNRKIKNGKRFEEVLRLSARDGSWRWISSNGKSYFRDATGKVCRAVGLLIDITELKRAEKALERINKRLGNIIEGTNLGTWEWYLNENSVLINQRWAEIIGHEKKDITPMLPRQWFNRMHPSDLLNVKEQLKQVKNRTKKFIDLELRVKHKEGHWVWIKTHGKVIKWSNENKPLLVSGIQEDISIRKKLEENLKESEKQNRLLIEKMEHGLAVHEIIFDENNKPIDYRFLKMNKKFEELTGLDANKVIGKRVLEVLPETENYWIATYGRVALSGEPIYYEDYSSASDCWFKVSAYSPKPNQFAVLIDDISHQKKMENELYIEKEQFKTTLLSLGEGVISTDAKGKIVVMNKVASKLTEWSVEASKGKPLHRVFQIKNEITGRVVSDFVKEVLKANCILGPVDHLQLIAKTGSKFPIEVTASPIKDKKAQISGVVIVFNDISERREKEKQIEYLSFHDGLTGLYNRRYFEESLKRMDVSRNMPLSIMVLDVNGLKLTNDAFGHEAGDRLLITVANVLKETCRENDIIGRMGGDEFSIILPQTSKAVTQEIKHRIIQAIDALEDTETVISLGIGYATKVSSDENIKEIIIKSDQRMYRNKLKYGKNMRNQTIRRIINKINTEYMYEEEHTDEVANYAVEIAKTIGLERSEIEEIRSASLLHDIGKITVPLGVLMKSEPLSPRDLELIRRHPEVSYQILKSVDQHVKIANTVLHHHERWDGQGYPGGLSQEEIPLEARILTIADAYQAMTSERVYKSKKSKPEAIKELVKYAGHQFDPKLVKLFVEKILI